MGGMGTGAALSWENALNGKEVRGGNAPLHSLFTPFFLSSSSSVHPRSSSEQAASLSPNFQHPLTPQLPPLSLSFLSSRSSSPLRYRCLDQARSNLPDI